MTAKQREEEFYKLINKLVDINKYINVYEDCEGKVAIVLDDTFTIEDMGNIYKTLKDVFGND